MDVRVKLWFVCSGRTLSTPFDLALDAMSFLSTQDKGEKLPQHRTLAIISPAHFRTTTCICLLVTLPGSPEVSAGWRAAIDLVQALWQLWEAATNIGLK